MKLVTYDEIRNRYIEMPADYSDTLLNFVKEYRHKVDDLQYINRVACRFLDEKTRNYYTWWCVNEIKHLMKDERSIKAVDILKLYIDGKATIKELEIAAHAAVRAAFDAAVAYAAFDAAVAYAAFDAVASAYAAGVTAWDADVSAAWGVAAWVDAASSVAWGAAASATWDVAAFDAASAAAWDAASFAVWDTAASAAWGVTAWNAAKAKHSNLQIDKLIEILENK